MNHLSDRKGENNRGLDNAEKFVRMIREDKALTELFGIPNGPDEYVCKLCGYRKLAS